MSTAPRVVAITTVRNEADVIEAFVRHTATFVDRIVVLDNGSTDATVPILEALAAAGCPVLLLSDPSIGYRQWQRMTRVMREVAVAQLGADWILPLDADEFIVPASDVPLGHALQRAETPVHVSWVTYVPHPSDDPNDINPATRLRHRASRETDWRKVFVPKALAASEGVRLGQGNHEVELRGVACPAIPLRGAHLAHLPVRSSTQFASKISVSQLQRLAMHDGNATWGDHIRRFYDALKADPDRFDASCAGAALAYAPREGARFDAEPVYDPLPYRGGPLTFTPHRLDPPLRTVLEYAEQLARVHVAAVSELAVLTNRQTMLEELARSVEADREHTARSLELAEEETRRLRSERAFRLAAGARALWHAARRALRADLDGAARHWQLLRSQFRDVERRQDNTGP